MPSYELFLDAGHGLSSWVGHTMATAAEIRHANVVGKVVSNIQELLLERE